MTIILDLDDVLANLRESIYRTLATATGIDFHWRHWHHYDDLREHFAVVEDQLEALLIEGGTLEICQPEPGAPEATWMLKDLGFEIAIVTARGWHPDAHPITRQWLATHGIPYDHLRIIPLGGNKLEVLEPFAPVALAVDDHPANIAAYHRAGIPALMMDRPWNADFAGERIYSLDAVVDFASNGAGPRS